MGISEIINSEMNVTLAIKKSDLFELFDSFTQQKATLSNELKKAQETEIYLSPAEVSKQLGVDNSTLWRWEKQNYLVGVKVGGKKRYRKSDIDKLMEG